MSLKFRIASVALAAFLSWSAVGMAQNPFATQDDAAGDAAAPANPFAAAPAAPEAPAPEAAPASPFADTTGAAPAVETAPASPFADTTGAAPASSPFADTTGAAPASPFGDAGDTSMASPFGDVGDATDASGVANEFDPITYWYKLEYPDTPAPADDTALPPGAPAPGGQQEPAQPSLDDATATREEITYTEYKRRYNERVQAIQLQYQNTNEQNWQQMGWDPRAMAEWKVYYEQMEAWKKYVEDSVIESKIPGAMADIDFATLDRDGVIEAAQGLSDSARAAADEATANLHALVVAMVERLDQRRNRRINYADWRAEQEAVFLDFAERWIKQSQGEEINIDGNMYLISDRPIQNAPRDVLPVVTTNLTPYDIFNDDGTLKRPQ